MAKNIIWLPVLIILSAASALAQQPAPSPPPAPQPTPRTTQIPAPVPRRTTILPGSMLPPPFASPIEADPMAVRMMIVQKYAQPMYRKASGRELRQLAPDPAVIAEYREFLRRPDAGIFKLVPDAGCAGNTKVINASESCLKYQFPGAGNSYSFRTEGYGARQLADITYASNSFLTTGVLTHGILVDLGDVPIEQVSLSTAALKVVKDFQPARDFGVAVQITDLLAAGIRNNGYLYRSSVPAVVSHTYVLRSVAYQGRVMRAVPGAEYNELDFDKRNDVVAAFRLVKIGDDGTATIVWSKLATFKSPKLKTPASNADNKFSGRAVEKTDGNSKIPEQP